MTVTIVSMKRRYKQSMLLYRVKSSPNAAHGSQVCYPVVSSIFHSSASYTDSFFRKSNFQAPLEKQLEDGITVLGSGCGPAAWTFEMAEQFPNSKFHGHRYHTYFS
jgi:hypothetical protein